MKKTSKTQPKETTRPAKENRIGNNPWNQEPIKKPGGFGMLNDILDKAYGQEPTSCPLAIRHKQDLQETEQHLAVLKTRYDRTLNFEKELLYGKYRQHFELQRKMVQLNKIIAFVGKSDSEQLAVRPSIPLSSSWIQVPTEAQTTFIKLFYQISRGETIPLQPSLLPELYRSMESSRTLLKERLFM